MIEPEGENPETIDVKSPTKNTRLLDNHYDPKIHEKPWISPGHLKDYKYEYSDSGLGFLMNKQKKMKNFKERHEQIKEVEELNKKSRGFRHFREYDNVCNNEILITIEYCTNCKQHQGSTRHDEEKYAYFANTLKREIITQYPVIKVVLKPLIFELNDESTESIYLRSRLGAFEVQLFSKNNKGEAVKRYIFSKLRTRAWPSISTVVENIASSLPTDDFVVRLVDLNFNSEEFKEENETQNKQQPGKLKGLHVILRPYKSGKKSVFGSPELAASGSKGFGDSRISGTGASRPTSGVMRPQSAYSVTSNKSTMSMKKSQSPTGPEEKAKEYVELSDNHGVVVFKQVPHNIYEIEVLETHNYLPEKRIVNVFEMIERGAPLKEDVILKDQTMGFCRVKLTENRVAFTDANIIVAKKNPDPNSKTAVLREKDPKSGLFEFMIDPGEYILSINKAGFGERKEEIVANRGTNEFTFEVGDGTTHGGDVHRSPERQIAQGKTEERPNTGSRQRPPSSKGRHEPQGFSGSKPNVRGGLEVIPQENQESSPTKKDSKAQGHHGHGHGHVQHEEEPKKERVKSAMVKKVEFSVLDIDNGKPVTGVTVMLDEIGFKGATNEQGKCLVPINKLNNGKLILDHENYFGMVEEYGDDGIDLKSTTEKKFSLIPRPHDIHEVQFRFLPGNGVPCAKFSVLYDQSDEDSKKDIVVKHSEGGKELITCRNLLKKHGVFRIIAEISDMEGFFHPESMFILSHYGDCDQLYIFPPAERLLDSERLVWDAGFFADPAANAQFVEINGYSTTDITLYSSLKEYQMLLNYLHNSKSDLKTLLGFKEKNRIEKEGDIFVSKEAIYSSLDKYGLEIKNVDHLLSSACTPEGLYSFRECERRFGGLKPPFNFVKDQKRNVAAAGLEDEGEEDDDEEEEEYLFEDEK